MNIIPCFRCKSMKESLRFYQSVLDFKLVFSTGDNDPDFSVLERGGSYLHLSSHSGDGAFGAVAAVVVTDIDTLCQFYQGRGHKTEHLDSPVHRAPLDQTWGTREFYIEDPNGNTLRYVQYKDK